jgi:hypothetical protein
MSPLPQPPASRTRSTSLPLGSRDEAAVAATSTPVAVAHAGADELLRARHLLALLMMSSCCHAKPRTRTPHSLRHARLRRRAVRETDIAADIKDLTTLLVVPFNLGLDLI